MGTWMGGPSQREIDRRFWRTVAILLGIGFVACAVLGCGPSAPPVVTPQPTTHTAYLILASPKGTKGIVFRATMDTTVVRIVWRKIVPHEQGRTSSGVAILSGSGRDTLATLTVTRTPRQELPPWKVEVLEASAGREKVGLSLVSVLLGVP